MESKGKEKITVILFTAFGLIAAIGWFTAIGGNSGLGVGLNRFLEAASDFGGVLLKTEKAVEGVDLFVDGVRMFLLVFVY